MCRNEPSMALGHPENGKSRNHNRLLNACAWELATYHHNWVLIFPFFLHCVLLNLFSFLRRVINQVSNWALTITSKSQSCHMCPCTSVHTLTHTNRETSDVLLQYPGRTQCARVRVSLFVLSYNDYRLSSQPQPVYQYFECPKLRARSLVTWFRM